jgi:AmiR/NasT family two-component response regulator
VCDVAGPRGVRVVGSEAYEPGSALAAVASLGLLADRETADLRVALASRDVIGHAKGILMERFQISSDETFRMLLSLVAEQHVKLRAVAAQLVW